MPATALVLVTLALVGHALTTVGLLHLQSSIAPVLIHAASSAAWFICLVFGLWLLSLVDAFWWTAATFAFFVMTYLFGYSALYKSVSLRMLVMLSNGSDQTLTLSSMESEFVRRNFDARAEMLIRAHMIRTTPVGLELSCRGQNISARLSALRKFFGVVSSGVYFGDS